MAKTRNALKLALLLSCIANVALADGVFYAPGSGSGAVSSFNTRTGAVTLTGTDIGGVSAFVAQSHKFLTSMSSAGAFSAAQPVCADVSDATAFCNLTTTNGVTLGMLATQAANTVLANTTASTAAPSAVSIPSCSTNASAIQYTSGTGFSCSTTLTAKTVTISKAFILTAAATIGSGFGTGPTLATNGSNGGAVTIGTSPGTTGSLTLGTANAGWACQAADITTPTEVVSQTATSTTSATFTFYSRITGSATAPTAADVVTWICFAY